MVLHDHPALAQAVADAVSERPLARGAQLAADLEQQLDERLSGRLHRRGARRQVQPQHARQLEQRRAAGGHFGCRVVTPRVQLARQVEQGRQRPRGVEVVVHRRLEARPRRSPQRARVARAGWPTTAIRVARHNARGRDGRTQPGQAPCRAG